MLCHSLALLMNINAQYIQNYGCIYLEEIMETILATNGLCRDFVIGDGSVIHALKNVNITVNEGVLTILKGR